jgi:hypothetical protein
MNIKPVKKYPLKNIPNKVNQVKRLEKSINGITEDKIA